MKLAALQREFLGTLDTDKATGGLHDHLRPGPGADRGRRLDVYRNNFRETHLQALATTYPVCIAVLGKRYWRQLVIGSGGLPAACSSDLNTYGEHIPVWLEQIQDLIPQLAPFAYLPDLARLEWRVHQARLAADVPGFDFAAFARASEEAPDRVSLQHAPGLSVFHSPWPVDVIWHRHAGEGRPDFDAQGAADCCIWRDGEFAPQVSRLGPDQALMLRAIATGSTLTELEHRCPPAARKQLPDWLFAWIRLGWITGFYERNTRV